MENNHFFQVSWFIFTNPVAHKKIKMDVNTIYYKVIEQ